MSARRDFLTLATAPPFAAARHPAPLGPDANMRQVHRTAQLVGQRADRERTARRAARVDWDTCWRAFEDGE